MNWTGLAICWFSIAAIGGVVEWVAGKFPATSRRFAQACWFALACVFVAVTCWSLTRTSKPLPCDNGQNTDVSSGVRCYER